MPMMSSAQPEFGSNAGWSFGGLDPDSLWPGSMWADRLVALSMAPHGASTLPGSAMPSASDLTTPRPTSPIASLSAALAGIIAIAAQRALAAGEMPKLREAIDRALEGACAEADAKDPREAGLSEMPRISDSDPEREQNRLLRLMRRQAAA